MLLLARVAMLLAVADALVLPSVAPSPASTRAVAPTMQFGWGGGGARDADLARRQDKLDARKKKAAEIPKGSVEVTFPQKGNKMVIAKQGENIGKVAQRAGLRIKYDCKNGRCATCQVRLNGRATEKVCQGAKIPGGATRKLSITLDNP